MVYSLGERLQGEFRKTPTLGGDGVRLLDKRVDYGEGNGNPLQYSCPEDPMDRGAWWATVHEASRVKTQLSD